MAFWNKREKRAVTSGLMTPSGWMFDALSTSPSNAGTRVTVEKALGLSPVWAAVSLIAEQVGQLPLKVYRDLGDGQKEEARSHRSWRLLHDRPNSQTPAGRFWSTVAVHLLLWGNCFIEMVRDEAGIVDELWLIHPSKVSVKWWPNLREKTFVHRPKDMQREQRELDSSEVLHVMNMSGDGLTGLSVIENCRQTFGTALARDEFEAEFYRRGAVLSAVLEMDGTIKNPQALERLSTAFKALFTGAGRRHGVPVLEDGVKLKQVGSPLKDLEFVASQNMTATSIATIFKIPPNYLGGSSGDGLTYATVEANQIQFALNAIAPMAKTITDALSQEPALMPQNVHWAEFTLEGMLRADTSARADFYEKLVNMKAMLPDEVRAKENLPPLTPAQKRELNPPPPPQTQEPDDGSAAAPAPPAGVNGNGNGAMPAINRS